MEKTNEQPQHEPLLLTCEHATRMALRAEEEKLSTWAKLRMHMHLFLCKYCRRFFRQSQQLDEVMHQHVHQHVHANGECLSASQRERLEQTLEIQAKNS